jgi:hypothetical protein
MDAGFEDGALDVDDEIHTARSTWRRRWSWRASREAPARVRAVHRDGTAARSRRCDDERGDRQDRGKGDPDGKPRGPEATRRTCGL